MSEESQGLDPYAAVLADLKAKRDQIDEAIRVIESLRSGVVSSATGPHSAAPHQPHQPKEGEFLGMSIPDAVKKLLASRRKTMNNADIVAALQAGGLAMTSKDPQNTVGSVLTRRFNTVGDIVRVGRGIWGLQEWYPNRNFKRDRKPQSEEASDTASDANRTEDATTDSSEPAQPSEQPQTDPWDLGS